MATVTAFEAKTRFGELLERVSKGEEVVITRHDKPVAVWSPRAHHGMTTSGAALKACATSNSGFDDDRRPDSRIGMGARPSTMDDHDPGVRRRRLGGDWLGPPRAGDDTHRRDAGCHR